MELQANEGIPGERSFHENFICNISISKVVELKRHDPQHES